MADDGHPGRHSVLQPGDWSAATCSDGSTANWTAAPSFWPTPSAPARGASNAVGRIGYFLTRVSHPLTARRPVRPPEEGPPDERFAPPQDLRLPPETAGLFAAGDPNNYYFIIDGRDGRVIAPFHQCAASGPDPSRPADNWFSPNRPALAEIFARARLQSSRSEATAWKWRCARRRTVPSMSAARWRRN